MKEIIEWAIGIEQLAGNLYSEAASFFDEDKELAAFLGGLAEDEAWHFHLMGSAAEFLRTHPETAPAQIALDDDTHLKILKPFAEIRRQLEEGLTTKDSVLFCIATTEFSEWNDLFLYIVNSLKEKSREFQYVAARMQGHLKHIMDFLETRPEGSSLLEEIRHLPPVWREKILIVEDSPALMLMLERVFSRDFGTVTAENGREGMEKLKENYFDVVISDIDMPVMNGIEFFRRAVENDPLLARRFLFFSGLISEEHKKVIDAFGVASLQKPASIAEIKKKVAEILERNSHITAAGDDSRREEAG